MPGTIFPELSNDIKDEGNIRGTMALTCSGCPEAGRRYSFAGYDGQNGYGEEKNEI